MKKLYLFITSNNTLKILFFMFFILYSVLIFNTSAEAAKKPSLNKTNVFMSTADTVKLKVFNTNKKVTWSSSNKEVARINSKGKVTPVWFGKTVISAKIGKKILKCTVNVLEEDVWSSSDDPSYSVSIMKISNKKVRVEIWIYDDEETVCSGNLTAKYTKNGNLSFLCQGKYDISGEIILVEQNREEYCILMISEADDERFLIDTLILDDKIENS